MKALPLPWFSRLAILLNLVETTGNWPQELLDAYIVMIPKQTMILPRWVSAVPPVVYRIWASLWLGHLRDWVLVWLTRSVFGLGNGLSSGEAWFSIRY